ncbi:hypothetical protein H8S20_15950 [Clostridium sp. NSJ-6]|uniref:Uncharacterized protein n=1 Tax=Clostridium hominis TaxID=2763036 RepID=A0ABR7DG26_9CLOT|nr:DUF6514 family protein [Clostridium hominis]MBC5630356.1 hypothetical protein [Clostridium hominis]MDU2673241.1 DUF6514 family protein [Clostridium sp.]
MKIVESLSLAIENKGKKIMYFYRLTQCQTKTGQAFGIEVERQDLREDVLVNIERDSVDIISTKEDKVRSILELLYKNNVSPIHLIDVIGSYVDECIEDFNDVESLVGSM